MRLAKYESHLVKANAHHSYNTSYPLRAFASLSFSITVVKPYLNHGTWSRCHAASHFWSNVCAEYCFWCLLCSLPVHALYTTVATRTTERSHGPDRHEVGSRIDVYDLQRNFHRFSSSTVLMHLNPFNSSVNF